MNPRLKTTLVSNGNRVALGLVAWAALAQDSDAAANFLKFYTFAVIPGCVTFLLVAGALAIMAGGRDALPLIKRQLQKNEDLIPGWIGQTFNVAMIAALAASGWIVSATVWFLYAAFSFFMAELAKDTPKEPAAA